MAETQDSFTQGRGERRAASPRRLRRTVHCAGGRPGAVRGGWCGRDASGQVAGHGSGCGVGLLPQLPGGGDRPGRLAHHQPGRPEGALDRHPRQVRGELVRPAGRPAQRRPEPSRTSRSRRSATPSRRRCAAARWTPSSASPTTTWSSRRCPASPHARCRSAAPTSRWSEPALITTGAYAKAHPEVVRSVVAGTLAGVKAVVADPAAALSASAGYIPGLDAGRHQGRRGGDCGRHGAAVEGCGRRDQRTPGLVPNGRRWPSSWPTNGLTADGTQDPTLAMSNDYLG